MFEHAAQADFLVMEHTLALPPGCELHEYEIASLLGVGGFGFTYAALDRNIQKSVAIKEFFPVQWATRRADNSISPSSSEYADSVSWASARFLDEARTLSHFHHENIVAIHRFFELNGTAYIVMDYVEGETLSSKLKKSGQLSETEIRSIIWPILDGLVEVHKKSVIHRDIKPDNILISKSGKSVLIDFGAARIDIENRTSLTGVFTPAYAPLEQISGEHGSENYTTDIFALAGVMYRCATGHKPPSSVERRAGASLSPASKSGNTRCSLPFFEAIDVGLSLFSKDRPQSIVEWMSLFDERATSPSVFEGEAETVLANQEEGGSSGLSGAANVVGIFFSLLATGALIYWLMGFGLQSLID